MKQYEIQNTYNQVKKKILANLASSNIKIPLLYESNPKKSKQCAKKSYTIGGLTLVLFAKNVGKIVTKEDLIFFLKEHGCNSSDPQPRHLGMQMGLNFLVNNCHHPKIGRVLRRGEYCLLDLKNPHPSRASMHRVKTDKIDFVEMKKIYDNRCACCGSKENDLHFKNPLLITRIEMGHCDPQKPLSNDNCIPMCNMCNMVYKNKVVVNKRGFITHLLDSKDEEVQWKECVQDDADDEYSQHEMKHTKDQDDDDAQKEQHEQDDTRIIHSHESNKFSMFLWIDQVFKSLLQKFTNTTLYIHSKDVDRHDRIGRSRIFCAY